MMENPVVFETVFQLGAEDACYADEFSRQNRGTLSDADAIVSDGMQIAVGISYKFSATSYDNAPIVTAKGVWDFYDLMIKNAKKHQIPIFENPSFARLLLVNTEIGGVIPEELYQPAAELLALAFQKRFGKGDNH